MKRLIGLIMAAILVLAVGCAAAEADGVTFTTSYFTLKLPAGWETDTEDLESEEGEQCLGYFAAGEDVGLVGAAYLELFEEMKDVSLWNCTEEQLKDYEDMLIDDFVEYKPELIGVVMADRIPLVLLRGSDEEGEFVYAETMTNGYAIEFEFYVTDYEGDETFPVTDEHIEQIKNILATFQPVG